MSLLPNLDALKPTTPQEIALEHSLTQRGVAMDAEADGYPEELIIHITKAAKS